MPRSKKNEKYATKSSNKRKNNGETAKRVAETIKNGATSTVEIAQIVGISVAAVRNHLKSLENPRKRALLGIQEDVNAILGENRAKKEKEEEEKIIDMAKNMTDEEIAKKMGKRKSRVTLIRRKLGIRSRYQIITEKMLAKMSVFPAKVTIYGDKNLLRMGLANPHADFESQKMVNEGLWPQHILAPVRMRWQHEDFNAEIDRIMRAEWVLDVKKRRGKGGGTASILNKSAFQQGLH